MNRNQQPCNNNNRTNASSHVNQLGRCSRKITQPWRITIWRAQRQCCDVTRLSFSSHLHTHARTHIQQAWSDQAMMAGLRQAALTTVMTTRKAANKLTTTGRNTISEVPAVPAHHLTTALWRHKVESARKHTCVRGQRLCWRYLRRKLHV